MSRRRGITILEVLVVLVLAVVVVGVAAVLLLRHRENSLGVQCRNNLRVIGKAFHGYHDASSADEAMQRLPPSRIADGYATWAVLLAPHLAKEGPLLQWDKQLPYFAQTDDVREARPVMYFCPARKRSDWLSQAGDLDKQFKHQRGGLSDYASVAGDGDPLHDWTGPDANGPLLIAEVFERKDERIIKWQSRTGLASLTRGVAYTALVGEKHVPASHFGAVEFGDGSVYNGAHPASFSRVAGPGFPLADSEDAPFNKNFGSSHAGICNFLMADGSFRAMSNNTAEFVLGEMARRR
jgi:hypothetical protein